MMFIVFCFLLLFWLSGVIWYIIPYKAMNWLFHDIMHWHKPIYNKKFNGIGYKSKCRFCGKEILEDGHGGWFEV